MRPFFLYYVRPKRAFSRHTENTDIAAWQPSSNGLRGFGERLYRLGFKIDSGPGSKIESIMNDPLCFSIKNKVSVKLQVVILPLNIFFSFFQHEDSLVHEILHRVNFSIA